jgi:SAM-dependent methyltransferase
VRQRDNDGIPAGYFEKCWNEAAYMAHTAQLEFVSLLAESLGSFFRNQRVLEIGSLDISGSVRGFFQQCDYVGLDVGAGAGVDVVCEGQKYDAPDASFDVVLSCEAMEHNPYWEQTFRNMIRLCRPGGLVIMTCATTGRPEHGTARSGPSGSPLTVELGWNYYKNLTAKHFVRTTDLEGSFAQHRFWTNWNHFDLLFAGIRRGRAETIQEMQDWERAVRTEDAWLDDRSGARVHSYRSFAARTVGDSWFRLMHKAMDTLAWLHKSR